MRNIAVIGAGNIGRRHLQALAKLNGDFSIYSVDPVTQALEIADQIFNEVKTNTSPKLYLKENINSLPQKLFCAIIATNSKERISVVQILMDKNIHHIIFEKVLFQHNKEYQEVQYIIKQTQIKAWVNCWRRIVPFYQELKKKHQNDELTSFSVNGNNWSMTSNSIHFIDLLNYFTGSTEYQFTKNNVSIMKSKRDGYYEFVGTLEGVFGKKKIPFTFTSHDEDDCITCEVNLNLKKNTITINDDEEWWIENSSGNKSEKQKMDIPFQSDMTQCHIIDLAENGNCKLTPFAISSNLHLPMIDYFTKIFKQNNILGCPIT